MSAERLGRIGSRSPMMADAHEPDLALAPRSQTKVDPETLSNRAAPCEFDDRHFLNLSVDDVLEESGITRHLLAHSYDELQPGAQLTITIDTRLGAPRQTRRFQLSLSKRVRDRLSTLLFAEGFEYPRFHFNFDDRTIVTTAIRSKKAPPATRRQVLSVVMPVYNERATFHTVIDQLLSKQIDGVDLELIVVESNSSDGTREDVLSFAEHPLVRVLLEDRPSGKGHAVRVGLTEATGDFVLIQDADLEYDIDDYESLLEPLRRFEAAFVLGIRTRSEGARWGVRHFEKQVLVGWLMNFGNFLFLNLFNRVYGKHLRDPFTMYKVLRRDCLYRMRLESNRFDFDWELMAKLLRAGYEPVEVPVTYKSRSFSEGKKVSVLRDPLTWVRACLRYRFASFEEQD
jgi:hypothetical protein